MTAGQRYTNGAPACWALRWSALLLALLLLAGCGQEKKETHVHLAPNGDLREETASLDQLPSFLDGKPAQVKLAYQAAAKLTDTLQWIPCYCGCGESAGHGHNFHCFIHEVREDGAVVWDDHGTRCGVCVHIALQSAALKSEGLSDAEIRRRIDDLYREGFADPTDTPMPPA